MDENFPTRVTRSLRRRLNSTESEPSSNRAGTPTRGTPLKSLNLESIAEDSPTRGRGRRRSLNIDTVEAKTPSKAISKLAAVAESTAVSSPRRTRRASMSQEDLKPVTPAKVGRRSSLLQTPKEPVSTESPRRGRPKALKDVIASDSSNDSSKRGRSKLVSNDKTAEESTAISESKSPSGSPIITRSQTKSPNIDTNASRSATLSPNTVSPSKIIKSSSKSSATKNESNTAATADTEVNAEEDETGPVNSTAKENTINALVEDKKSKSIQFVDDDDDFDEKEKTRYLKTPHVSKSRSISTAMENSAETSFDLLDINKFKNKEINSNENVSSESFPPDENAMKTPYKKLVNVSSSTPIVISKENYQLNPSKLQLSLKEISEENLKVDEDENKLAAVDQEQEMEDQDNVVERMDVDISEVEEQPKASPKQQEPEKSTRDDEKRETSDLKIIDKDYLGVVDKTEEGEPSKNVENSEIEPSEKNTNELLVVNGKELEAVPDSESVESQEKNESKEDSIVKNTDFKLHVEDSIEIANVSGRYEKSGDRSDSCEEQTTPIKKSDRKESKSLTDRIGDEKLRQDKNKISGKSPKQDTDEVFANKQEENSESSPKLFTANKEVTEKQAKKPLKTAEMFREEANVISEMIKRASLSSRVIQTDIEPLQEKTPHSTENSLGIESNEAKSSVAADVSLVKGTSPNRESTYSDEPKVINETFASSWSASVRRSASGKIDKFEGEPKEEVIEGKPRNRPKFVIDGDDDDDDDENEEIVSEEEKNSLIDDEAEEAGEEEDSMDEEEREYLRQNEIPEKGHSIGSEDTESEECEEEDDDDSFIVDDSDCNEKCFSDDDDDCLADKGKTKKYKRIQVHSESSDEDKPIVLTSEEKQKSPLPSPEPMDVDEGEPEQMCNTDDTFLAMSEKEAMSVNVKKCMRSDSVNEKTGTKMAEGVILVSDSDDNVGSPNLNLKVSDSESGDIIEIDCRKKQKRADKSQNVDLNISTSRKSSRRTDTGEETEEKLSSAKKRKRFSKENIDKTVEDVSSDEDVLNTSVKKKSPKQCSKGYRGTFEDSFDSDKEELEGLQNQCLSKSFSENRTKSLEKEISDNSDITNESEVLAKKRVLNIFTQETLHNSLNQSYGKYGQDNEELCSGDDTNLHAKKNQKKLRASFSEDLLRKKNSDSKLIKANVDVVFDKIEVENVQGSTAEPADGGTTSDQKRRSKSKIEQQESNELEENGSDHDVALVGSAFVQTLEKKVKSPDSKLQIRVEDTKNEALNKIPKAQKSLREDDILNACDLYLQAANLAKRQVLLQNKKTLKEKTLKKRMEKKKKFHEEKEKEEKRRVFENAIKKKKVKTVRRASVTEPTLLNEEIIVNVEKPVMITKSDSKCLPENILSTLSECESKQKSKKAKAKKVKSKQLECNSEENLDHENKVKKQKKGKLIKTAGGVFLEEPLTPTKPKKKILEILKTRSGIVKVESLSPERSSSNEISFREEDQTPKAIGFKIRQILSAGQKGGGIPKLNLIKRSKKQKAVFEEEPSNILPKPKWKKFEDEEQHSLNLPKYTLSAPGTLFSVTKSGDNILGVNANALNFKKNALFNNDKIKRVSAKEIAARKRKF